MNYDNARASSRAGRLGYSIFPLSTVLEKLSTGQQLSNELEPLTEGTAKFLSFFKKVNTFSSRWKERGHEFARTVAEQLRENGWQVRNEVQMSELGASANLGDVDVLAWKPTGEIQIIECKRLQLARTVAEIAEICRRFRGDAKDELSKHVCRVVWLKANPAGLKHIVGFMPDPISMDDRLITNTHVPMSYLTGLPIEANKIGPLK